MTRNSVPPTTNQSRSRTPLALGGLGILVLLVLLFPFAPKADLIPPPDPGDIKFASATYTVDEWAASKVITVKRVNGKDGPVTVQYATANGTATAGSDYTAASGTLSWADQDDADKTFSVSITDDSSAESDETFTATLSNPTGGAVLIAPTVTTVTIMDNESVDCDGDSTYNPTTE